MLGAVTHQIKSGDFLDRARIRRIAVICLAVSIASLAALLATSDGFRDKMGRPLGTDFMAFHIAGSIAREQGGGAAYDARKQYEEHQKTLREKSPSFWPFLYPPAFLFVAVGLAALPYLAGWLFWMGATLSIYAAGMQRIAPGGFPLLLSVAFPAVYLNFLHGQNAFLIAALFAFGLVALKRRRPIAAGLILGLISIKPQYGLLIPIALAASGNWRAFAAAGASVTVLAAAPAAAFGPEVWTGFIDAMKLARTQVVEAGAIGFEKIQSAFAQARLLGASVFAAYAIQAALFLFLSISVFRLWRGGASFDIKAAGLIVAAALATPYAVDYDFVVLAPACAFLILDALRRGFQPYEKSLLLIVAIAPAIARAVGATTHISAGFIAALALFFFVLRRARAQAPVAASHVS